MDPAAPLLPGEKALPLTDAFIKKLASSVEALPPEEQKKLSGRGSLHTGPRWLRRIDVASLEKRLRLAEDARARAESELDEMKIDAAATTVRRRLKELQKGGQRLFTRSRSPVSKEKAAEPKKVRTKRVRTGAQEEETLHEDDTDDETIHTDLLKSLLQLQQGQREQEGALYNCSLMDQHCKIVLGGLCVAKSYGEKAKENRHNHGMAPPTSRLEWQ